MSLLRSLFFIAIIPLLVPSSQCATVSATFSSAFDVPVTAASYTASGNDVAVSLNYAPGTGTNLTIVRNTGLSFISGQFTNLTHGQSVNLTYAGQSYRFIANYYGGTGNDLVLEWQFRDISSWGPGQLGNGSTDSSRVPVLVTRSGVLSGKTVVAVSAGYEHSLALCSDGTLAAWGANSGGQLGNGSTDSSRVPVLVTRSGVLSGKTVVAVSAGIFHSLALCSDGTVAAWGANSSGQLGNNSTDSSSVPVLVARSGVLSGKTVVAVSAGYWHSLALCSDGTVAAWGSNSGGQLGNGSTVNSSVPVSVARSGVLSGKTVVAVSAGYWHSLALCSDGTVAAWGDNLEGKLGNNSTDSSSVPVSVARSGVLSGKTVVAVSAGYEHSLALCSDGTVAAWGSNSGGQLGNNSTNYSSVPALVTQSGVLSGKTVVAVSAGNDHSLTLCSDGTVAAWGGNYRGQLGNNSTDPSSVPVLVTRSGVLSGKTVVAVSAGGDYSLALCSDGTVAAWGENYIGRLGNGSTVNSSVPALVTQTGVLSGKTVVAVSAGNDHSLALCSDGTVAAWGRNSSGQLGNGSSVDSNVPVLVTRSGVLSGKTVVAVSAGYEHSLALCSDGTLAAWGGNFEGKLGNNSTDPSSVPVLVTRSGVLSGKTVVAVSAGNDHSLALCSDGTVAAWGNNYHGQLGNGSADYISTVPVLVTRSGVLSGKTVVAVSAGGSHSLARCSDGTVAAWGYNYYGQLGNGSTVNSSVPVLVTRSGVLSGKTVVAVSAGIFHSLALCSDGTVAAWGDNFEGTLGNNSTDSSSVPVSVARSGVLSGKTVVAVSAGYWHSLALCSDGTVAAWGRNSGGQLGNNSTDSSSVPVSVTRSGVLSGKTVVAISAGGSFSVSISSYDDKTAGLSSLSLISGDINPEFHPNTYDYSASVSYSTSSIAISPSALGEGFSVLKVNGSIVTSGSNSQLIPLAVGANAITILVTAPNGVNAKTYTIHVNRKPASSIATLDEMILSNGTLSPAFAPATTNYSVSVSGDINAVALRPIPTESGTSIKVNGKIVAYGNYSQPIQLSTGVNVITVVGAAQDGTINKTYSVVVTRPPSSTSTLSSMNLSSGTLSPSFASNTLSYNADVANLTSAVTITPTATSDFAAVRVNGLLVVSGSPSQSVAINVGSNTISIVVTAEDGTSVSTYTVVVTRAPSNISSLSSLFLSSGALSPVFNADTLSYTAVVSDTISSVTVTPTTTSPFATVRVNGSLVTSGSASQGIPLSVGSNAILVISTAEDGTTTSTYSIAVTRTSNIATLSSIVLSSGTLSPSFASATPNYTTSVANAVTSITVTPTTANVFATVRVNGTLVPSGTASQSIPLNVGSNTITVRGTAQNGTTTSTYTVVVTRVSNVATLSSLTLSSGTLNPAFAPSMSSYTASVANTITSITVTPTAANAFATVRVNGALVTSGTASQSIPLSVGSNTITVVGKAQDGATTAAYTISVTRFSNVATLSSLTLSSGKLSPIFATSNANYTAAVANSIASITVMPTLSESTATARVNGSLVSSGTSSQIIPLNVGSNVISVIGTAQDGATTSAYTLTVWKYQLTLINGGVAEGGTFTTSWDTGDVTKAMLTATPLTGFLVGSWTGDASGNTNPLTITMNSDKMVGATFVKDLSDSDGDGLAAYDELLIYGTNPAVADSDGDGLNDGWELGIGRFSIVTGSYTWQQARDDAKSKGGDLACFPTEDRWNRAMQNLGVNPFENYTGLWIGASDTALEGTWLWVNGETFNFAPWGAARPTSTAGNTLDFAEVSGGGGAEIGKWYDRSSTTVREGYLLETGYATSPLLADADADGLNDGGELAAGTNPKISDTDADGLSDWQEVNLTKTNPMLADTNGDGINDANSDQDGDSLGNLVEITSYGTNPIRADTDGDGLLDDVEVGFGRFALISTRLTWSQAKADAATRGGHLATFTSAVEYERMRAKIGITSLDSLDGAWVGATDETVDGTWQWASGEQDGDFIIPWGTGRPSNLNGNTLDYSEISGGEGAELWKWYDRSAAATRAGYILEAGFPTDPLITDTDGDGIADGVEMSSGLIPTLADIDGDGWNDGAEQEFGGNPRLASISPNFRCKLNTAPLGSQWIVRFPAAAGQLYAIEASDNLTSWDILESNIAGSGNIVTRGYPVTPSQPKRYFRVKRN